MEQSTLEKPKTQEEVILQAVTLIDKGLGGMIYRELVSTNEISDLLLDVRSILAPAP